MTEKWFKRKYKYTLLKNYTHTHGILEEENQNYGKWKIHKIQRHFPEMKRTVCPRYKMINIEAYPDDIIDLQI